MLALTGLTSKLTNDCCRSMQCCPLSDKNWDRFTQTLRGRGAEAARSFDDTATMQLHLHFSLNDFIWVGCDACHASGSTFRPNYVSE